MNARYIRTERRGAILIVTIDRPEAMNAFDDQTSDEMNAAMDLLDNDADLRVGIITGSATAFSSGADLKAIARGDAVESERGGFGIFKRPPGKPLIAAVEGFAVGGGFELCLCCDLIVAASNARFGLPEARHGVVAIGGGLFRLPRRIPYGVVMELALTGDLRTAEFFERYGLINRIVAPGMARDAALELADRILRNGPLALIASKRIVASAFDWTDEQAWEAQKPIAARAMDTEDSREGLLAFAEKRRPAWKGR